MMKSISASRLLGLLLWTQTLFVASTFRSWIVLITVSSFATLIVLARNARAQQQQTPPRPAPRWLTWLLHFLFFVVTGVTVSIWRIGSQVGEEINPIYVGVDIIAHAAMISSLGLWVARPRDGHLAMLPLGLVVVLLCVAAGGASVSLAAQTAVALTACLGFTIGSQIILGSRENLKGWFLGGGESTDRSAWLASLFSLLTLSILMMGTSAIANATSSVLPTIQNRLQEQLKSSLDAVGEQSIVGGTRYVRGGRLGSIRQHMLGNPQEIALRVHCQFPPGYMRGSAFDLYRRGRWVDSGGIEFSRFNELRGDGDLQIQPSGVGTTTLVREGNSPLRRFDFFNQSSSQIIHLEVHSDPLKGSVVFLPLATQWMEARSREVVVTNHGVIRHGVDVTYPYVAGVGPSLPRAEISAKTRKVCSDVSPSLLPIIRPMAESICQSSANPRQKAALISQYFQREYDYALTKVKAPSGVDPLVYFLESKHDAHCEFFASATVLMLRSVGVPARYVTGYVVDEGNEDEPELWLARNRDAHAWAEAYDDRTGRWFPVESTPGRTYQTVEPATQSIIANDVFSDLLDSDDLDNQTLIGRFVGWLVSIRATEPILILFRIAQLPLFLALSFVLWKRYIKPSQEKGDSIDVQSRKMLHDVDRRLRKLSLIRHHSETLYQFADRIERIASDPALPVRPEASERLSRAAHWYRDYANARYQGQLPQPLT